MFFFFFNLLNMLNSMIFQHGQVKKGYFMQFIVQIAMLVKKGIV
jgi:hypothetical protein